jgi:hypothetical protein
MIESQYTQAIHKLIPKELYRWKINDSFQGGVADAYYSGTNGDLWVEYKYLKSLPKRASTQVVPDLRPLQKQWLRDRHLEGRNVAVVIGSPSDSIYLRFPEWESGVSCEEFRDRSLTKQEIANWITNQCAKP